MLLIRFCSSNSLRSCGAVRTLESICVNKLPVKSNSLTCRQVARASVSTILLYTEELVDVGEQSFNVLLVLDGNIEELSIISLCRLSHMST